MILKFWGTRGSLPSSIDGKDIREKIINVLNHVQGKTFSSSSEIVKWLNKELPFWMTSTYGVSTACVELKVKESPDYIFCDAGTGIRDFSVRYDTNNSYTEGPRTFHIFLSHLHWDHIQGFPFFTPAYKAGNKIIIHGYHEQTEDAFRKMMSEPFFPVPFDSLKADIQFDIRKPETEFNLGKVKVKGITQSHPGISYGYRFEYKGKVVVYSTDCEHKKEALLPEYRFHKFFKDADVLIMDGQYRLAEAATQKENWGHSSNVICVELAAIAHAKHLVIFHIEPTNTDKEIDIFKHETLEYAALHIPRSAHSYPKTIDIGYSGLELFL